MSNRLAAIESAGRRLIVTTARAVIEKASGFSNYEAGDFLAGRADLLASHALFEQAADPQPPVGDDSAAEAYPHSAAESPKAALAKLPTSDLLQRAATTILVGCATVAVAIGDRAVPGEEVDLFVNELRDRAAQFAAHGD